MTYENSGILFKNPRKQKPNHPDYTGNQSITCPHCDQKSDFWLSAWLKEGKRGKFLSLALKIKESLEKAAAPEIDGTDKPAGQFDNIPF